MGCLLVLLSDHKTWLLLKYTWNKYCPEVLLHFLLHIPRFLSLDSRFVQFSFNVAQVLPLGVRFSLPWVFLLLYTLMLSEKSLWLSRPGKMRERESLLLVSSHQFQSLEMRYDERSQRMLSSFLSLYKQDTDLIASGGYEEKFWTGSKYFYEALFVHRLVCVYPFDELFYPRS